MTFTTDAVTEALHAIVAQKGADYVYPRAGSDCIYAEPDGSPSCIVGHVVAALEPEIFAQVAEAEKELEETTDALNLIAGWRAGYDAETGDYAVSLPALGEYGSEVANALNLAQTAQDQGLTWGEAVEFYDRYLAGGESQYDLTDEINARIRFKGVRA